MSGFVLGYNVLCEVLFEGIDSLESFLLKQYPFFNTNDIAAIVSAVKKRFFSQFKQRLIKVGYSKSRFCEKYSDWLSGELVINLTSYSDNKENVSVRGRPRKDFTSCTNRAKRYKVDELKRLVSLDLINAASSSASVLEGFDADAALALITQTKLSKYQYEVIRRATKEIGHNIFPKYKDIVEAKKSCYPENIEVSETSARVRLQDLLDHTASRILKTIPSDTLEQLKDQTLELHTKWGCDGSSGQSEYMQTFSNSNQEASDSHLFMTSIVPLKMTSTTGDNNITWINPRPSSTRYCRALKFEYKKETLDIIREEKNRVDNEIQDLENTSITVGMHAVKIKHRLYFTMIDGKVAQAVTNTSSASNCIICGAKPLEMNDLSKLQSKILNEETLVLGMSSLHARIRFMEYILHLGYNLSFKAWRTNNTTRAIKEEEKKRIQAEFLSKVGIRVDFVKQGTGTTNDGNTSRRFFGNPNVAADITKVDKRLITRLAVILEVICSNFSIDTQKFKMYTEETAKLAISLYPWYHMPATVHKILLHGAEIIESASLPVGSLSEEAQECRNKDYKYYRTHHSRKFSRLSTNEDVFHMILISSDPYITQLRPEPKKKHLPLSEEALELIK